MRNISDWPRLLALETSTILTYIYFLDLTIFWPLQFFYIGSFLSQSST